MTPAFALTLGVVCLFPIGEAPSTIPSGDNAALPYLVALSSMDDLSGSSAEVISSGLDRPEDAKTLRLLQANEPALRLLRRGAAMKSCSWGWGPAEASEVWLPLSKQMRRLSNIAVLRVRHSFEAGEPGEAVEDVLAMIAFARRLAPESYHSWAYASYVEGLALSTAARHLPGLAPAALQAFSKRLDELPQALPPVQALLHQAAAQRDSLRALADSDGPHHLLRIRATLIGSGASHGDAAIEAMAEDAGRFREWAEELGPLFNQVAEAADRPLPAVGPALRGLVKPSEAINPLAPIYLSQCNDVWKVEARSFARLAMFRGALAALADGPEALSGFPDPFGAGPFRFETTEGGFVLESALELPPPDWSAFLGMFRSVLALVDAAQAESLPTLPKPDPDSENEPAPARLERWRLVVGPAQDATP